VAGENASDLALVPLGQKFNAHSGIITDILFGSGYAGLGASAVALKVPILQAIRNGAPENLLDADITYGPGKSGPSAARFESITAPKSCISRSCASVCSPLVSRNLTM